MRTIDSPLAVITHNLTRTPLRSNLRIAQPHKRFTHACYLALIRDLKNCQLQRQTPTDPIADAAPIPLCSLCVRPFRTVRDACWNNVTTGYSLPVLAVGGYGYWEDIHDIYRVPLTCDEIVQEYASGTHVLLHRRCLVRSVSKSTIAHELNRTIVDEFITDLVAAHIPRHQVADRWPEVRAIVDKIIERKRLKKVLRLHHATASLQNREVGEAIRSGLYKKYGARMTAAGLQFP